MTDINVVIGGAAGQGVQWATRTLGRTLLRSGFQVYATQDYQSRIRGGHNFSRVRYADRPLGAGVRRADFLLALNAESLERHLAELTPEGAAFCIEGDRKGIEDGRILVLPQDIGPDAARNARFNGVKLLAMLAARLGLSREILAEAVRTGLEAGKGKEIIQANLQAIEAVFSSLQEGGASPVPLPAEKGDDRLLISGHDAVALGMIAAGVGVYAGYPMSPSTSIFNRLAESGPALGIAVEMTEDEIAAANIVIGASYAGVRAATGTSGGGIALMSEAIGLAGITETPLVIVNGQRSGPATGMATRTEQADLLFTVHTAQGEFPRAVLAPTDPQDAFYLTTEAFNLAERWQIPVFILTDHAIADAQKTVPEFDLSRVTIDRGAIAGEPEEVRVFERYQLTETGVSPRAFPVVSKWLVAQDSHEHDPRGHLSDEAQNRRSQVTKRLRKLDGIADSFPGPELIFEEAETMLICWGSTVGPVLEVLEKLREQGHDLGVAIFRHLYPMNREKVRAALRGRKKLLTIEANYTGQLGKLLLMETGIHTHGHLAKFDGRLFTVEDVLSLVGRALGDSA